MSKAEKISTVIVLVGVLFCLGYLAIASSTGGTGNTSQTFMPARYALITGPIAAATPGEQIVNCNSVLKFDTMTGQVWILQLEIANLNNPAVRTVGFLPVGMVNPNSLNQQQQNLLTPPSGMSGF